jgi:hypothetical protein
MNGRASDGEALPLPPGEFVSEDLQSDCARFLAELRGRPDVRAHVEWTLLTEED